VNHLDVVGEAYSINEMETKTSQRPAHTREPGRAVALGRVLVLTSPNFKDLLTDGFHRKSTVAICFTKSLSGPLFEKHISNYVGFDPYLQHELAGAVD
jgi:hypothetical protein